MKKRTVVDLFAGAGGATQGLIQAGWTVLAAVENDPFAVKTYEMNHPSVRLLAEDISEVDPDRLRKDLKLRRGELTLLKACPPCQGYSTLGGAGEDDPRNDLVHEVWKFVQAFRPRAVLLENVPGLRSDERLMFLLRRIRSVGYGARTYFVHATDFGVPQRRRRLIALAVRGKQGRQLPERIEDELPEAFLGEPLPTGKVLARAGKLGGRDLLHQPRSYSAVVLDRIRAIPAGGTRFDLPESLTLSCHSKIERRNATASYGRMSADLPAPTITTRCTTPACGQFIHPTEDRAITLREAALIQTFPRDYQFHGGRSHIERQIGNAVPVSMAEGLGLVVDSVLT